MTPASNEPLRQIDLAPVHAEAGFDLSTLIGWNQTADDWRFVLARGDGVGLLDDDDTLVATAMALPYGRFAWICLVLVAPDWRRQGIATRLMAEVVRRQEAAGRVPGLDATPDGRMGLPPDRLPGGLPPGALSGGNGSRGGARGA